ncbi:hypothetical protein L6R52_08560 [Myxococcota bacterium]|nr:hypothetical protein [Myxococcota bacterium]
MRLRVAVVRGTEEEWFFTHNVSHRGLFIRTPRPPKLHEVFKVRVVLPTGGSVLELHATAMFVKTPAERPDNPGVGVQFFGFGGVDAARWRQFVREIRRDHPATLEPSAMLDLCPEVQGEAHTRLAADHGTKIRLRVRSPAELSALYRTNLSKGAVLLPTEAELAVGTPLELVLVHPTSGATMSLTGTVRENVVRGSFRGVLLALTKLTPRRAAELLELVGDRSLLSP